MIDLAKYFSSSSRFFPLKQLEMLSFNVKLVIILLSCFIFVSIKADESDEVWQQFKEKYNKKYKNAREECRRRLIFEKNNAEIERHNSIPNVPWFKGHNEFSDMTEREVKEMLGIVLPDFVRNLPKPAGGIISVSLDKSDLLPATSLNYTSHRCMPPVKLQGSCGSCWAFAAITPIEFQYCLQFGELILRSEQQLISCDLNDNNQGCEGGYYTYAWDYLKTKGLMPEGSYPYTSGTTNSTGDTCNYEESEATVKVSSYHFVGDASSMVKALAKWGPLSVSVDTPNDLLLYKSGIYDTDDCASDGKTANHAMVVVGFGINYMSNTKYWIVRNSWGEGWGQQGYFLMKREVNLCNIESFAYFVTIQ